MATTTWFKVSKKYHLGIEAVEVEKSTTNRLWIDGHMVSKSTEWDEYFPTEAEAVSFLRSLIASRIEAAEDKLAELREASSELEKKYS